MRIKLSIVFFLITSILYSQEEEIIPSRFIRLNPILGINLVMPKIELSDWERLEISDEIDDLNVVHTNGYSVGILYTIQVSENVMFSPQTIISHRKIELTTRKEGEPIGRRVFSSTLLEIPFHLEIFTKKERKINPSLVLGGRYIYDNVLNSDIGIDIGFGLETQIGKFNIKPQFLYSFGLFNIKNNNSFIADMALSSLKQNTLSFRLILNKSRAKKK